MLLTEKMVHDAGDVDLMSYLRDSFLSQYGEESYRSWFENVKVSQYGERQVELSAPSIFVQKWITNNYLDVIKNWCKKYNPLIELVNLVSDDQLYSYTKYSSSKPSMPNTHNAANMLSSNANSTSAEIETFESIIDKRFTFDNFIVGKPNELAYAAARAVAESTYAIPKSNPLFLYGGVGLGKTHLMHAIALYIREHNPRRKVMYMSAEKFMYEFVKALKTKEVISFKDYFRSVDVLMIDDIQFICGKESTQEEFFHTFNALIDNNRQIVISCDRSPSDLDNIEDRIKSRLGWGLVADVHSTTYELRLGILGSKIERLGVDVPQDVVEFLASKITSNVRELEGALNKVLAQASLTKSLITLDSTQYLLKDLIRSNDRAISIEDIQQKIAEKYNIKLPDLFSPRRMRNIARPRQIAMYLCKQLTTKSLVEIGRQFGKKDHTTVMHAIKTVEEIMQTDKQFAEEVEVLKKVLAIL